MQCDTVAGLQYNVGDREIAIALVVQCTSYDGAQYENVIDHYVTSAIKVRFVLCYLASLVSVYRLIHVALGRFVRTTTAHMKYMH